jgi:hypothetical protein
LENEFRENSQNEAKILLATIDGITIDYIINPNSLKKYGANHQNSAISTFSQNHHF